MIGKDKQGRARDTEKRGQKIMSPEVRGAEARVESCQKDAKRAEDRDRQQKRGLE